MGSTSCFLEIGFIYFNKLQKTNCIKYTIASSSQQITFSSECGTELLAKCFRISAELLAMPVSCCLAYFCASTWVAGGFSRSYLCDQYFACTIWNNGFTTVLSANWWSIRNKTRFSHQNKTLPNMNYDGSFEAFDVHHCVVNAAVSNILFIMYCLHIRNLLISLCLADL